MARSRSRSAQAPTSRAVVPAPPRRRPHPVRRPRAFYRGRTPISAMARGSAATQPRGGGGRAAPALSRRARLRPPLGSRPAVARLVELGGIAVSSRSCFASLAGGAIAGRVIGAGRTGSRSRRISVSPDPDGVVRRAARVVVRAHARRDAAALAPTLEPHRRSRPGSDDRRLRTRLWHARQRPGDHARGIRRLRAMVSADGGARSRPAACRSRRPGRWRVLCVLDGGEEVAASRVIVAAGWGRSLVRPEPFARLPGRFGRIHMTTPTFACSPGCGRR